ncbi:MAG: hypothetical protein KIT45_06040 [Fimbriimonadia bacterium]|nr:hypothetical protein [Fimbriimonadia bacterium]
MKTWRKANWVRRWSMAAAVCTVLTPLLYPFSAAHAQSLELPRVAVLDFQNESGYGGNALARAASDSIASELSKSGRYEVLSRNEVDQQLKELDLVAPLDKVGYLRLAQALQVQSIFAGSVKVVTFDGSPKQANLALSVRVVDSASGEPVSGAAATGKSNPRPGYSGDDDTLVIEAVKNAAFEAVRTINVYSIPEATVLNTRAAREVVLNRGLRGGIKEGMEMIVIRRGEQVGRIRVTDVGDNDASGIIIEQTRGIQPEDRVRAVYAVPDVKVTGGGKIVTSTPKPKSGKNNVLRSLVPLALVAFIVFGIAKSASGGNTPLQDVTAEPTADGNFNPAVRVSWKTTLFAKDNDSKFQWLIYRSDQTNIDGNGNLIPIGVVPGNQNFFVDTNQDRTFQYASPDRAEPGDPNLTDGTGTAVGAGVSYVYQVALVYKERIESGQGESENVFRLSDRVFSGQATPIPPVTLNNPPQRSEDVDPRSVQFSWVISAGANAYRVQASTDPRFVNNVFTSGEIITTDQAGGLASTNKVNVQTALNLPTNVSTTVYWRVGGRNMNDTPGPAMSAGQRYVWSRTNEFKTPEQPPNP